MLKRIYFFLPLLASLFCSFTPMKKCTRVLFFGDSITEAGVYQGGYIAQMQDSLASHKLDKKFELIGSGIGGNKVYDLYLRLETDVLAQKPDVVVIYVGVNDIWHKETHHTGTDADKFQKFYQAIIRKLQKENIEVILCTPACIGEQSNNSQDADLDAYSETIRQLANANKCKLCDLREAFRTYQSTHNADNLHSNVLTTDGVHLNAKGNQMVAEMLLEKLRM
ncbi:MAG: SGNH/GDSL hydrolase family protein [Saprospiraceae bacterium]